MISACLIVSLLTAAPEPTRVSVDWAGVKGEIIKKCRLHQLKSTLLERLVQEGFAAVDEPDDDTIRVAIASNRRSIIVRASIHGQTRERVVAAPAECGKGFMLDAIFGALQVVREAALVPAAAKPPAEVVVPAEPEPRPQPSPETAALSVALGATAPGTSDLLAVVDIGLSEQWGRLRLQGDLSVDLAYADELFVFEPALAIAALATIDAGPLVLLGGVQATAVWHGFAFPNEGGGHFYARVGVPVAMEWDRWGLWMIPHLRTTATEHRIRGDTTRESGFWGVTMLVAGKLFGT